MNLCSHRQCLSLYVAEAPIGPAAFVWKVLPCVGLLPCVGAGVNASDRPAL